MVPYQSVRDLSGAEDLARDTWIDAFYDDLVLDPAVPIPLYYQLQQQVREKIEFGRLAPGQRLPAERTVAEELHVARETVRQAFDRLCDDGLLVRRRGAGTFVRPLKITSDLSLPRSLSTEMTAQGRRSSLRVLAVECVVPTRTLAKLLEVKTGSHTVIRIRRLRSLDAEPASLETAWLPADRCAPLLEVDLSGSLTAALLTKCGITPTYGRTELTATVLDDYEADLLGAKAGVGAFLLQAASWDDRGRPVEFVSTLLRGDRFQFRGGGPLAASASDGYPLAAAAIHEPTSVAGDIRV